MMRSVRSSCSRAPPSGSPLRGRRRRSLSRPAAGATLAVKTSGRVRREGDLLSPPDEGCADGGRRGIVRPPPNRILSMRLAAGLAAALLLTGFSTALAAPGPPEAVRAAVRTEIDGVLSSPEPDEPAWIRSPTAAMFRRVNINDDDVADWRIDYEKAPNPSYFCGTGGCRQQIWVSNAAVGYDLVFNLTVRTF